MYIYIDGLLQRLKHSKAGCWIGTVFVGALAYTDNIVLLAPTASGMHLLLQICQNYGQKFSIQFNATKSACMLVSKRNNAVKHALQFYIDGQQILIIDEFLHLGHTIVAQLDDNKEILAKRYELCGNNVLCYFKCCNPAVKIKLLHSYCSDFYGSVLRDISLSTVKSVCTAWRKGLRRLWDLPLQTHSRLIAPICQLLPIRDELLFRRVSFVVKCMSSDNSVVRTVSQHGVFFIRHMLLSPIGANARFCCNYFDVFWHHIDRINKQFVWRAHQQRVIMPEFNKINVIKELLNVKYNFASVPVLDLADIVFCIESLCTE